MSRIGLFGGTFNPPHLAHLRLATLAAEQCSLDEIIIMPTFLPPHKQASQLLSGEERMELCKYTFTSSVFSFSDFELKKGGKSYTVETLRHLKGTNPGDTLFLIIGSDMLLSFDRWFCWQEILQLSRLIVLSREDEITQSELSAYAERVLHLNEEEYDVLNCAPQMLSSTEIREKLQRGEDVSSFLTPKAYQRILEKGYYRWT